MITIRHKVALLVAPRILLSVAATAKASAGSDGATASGVVTEVGEAIVHGAKAAASGVARGTHAAARGIEHGAKAAETGVQRGIEAAAKGVERGAKATDNAAHTVAEKVGGSPPPKSSPDK